MASGRNARQRFKAIRELSAEANAPASSTLRIEDRQMKAARLMRLEVLLSPSQQNKVRYLR